MNLILLKNVQNKPKKVLEKRREVKKLNLKTSSNQIPLGVMVKLFETNAPL